MITEFENWFQTIRQEIENYGYEIEIKKSSPIEEEFIWVDFDSKDKIARITLWDVNECSLQIIEVDSEITVLNKYLIIESSSEFDKIFAKFFKILQQT